MDPFLREMLRWCKIHGGPVLPGQLLSVTNVSLLLGSRAHCRLQLVHLSSCRPQARTVATLVGLFTGTRRMVSVVLLSIVGRTKGTQPNRPPIEWLEKGYLPTPWNSTQPSKERDRSLWTSMEGRPGCIAKCQKPTAATDSIPLLERHTGVCLCRRGNAWEHRHDPPSSGTSEGDSLRVLLICWNSLP